MQSMFSQIFASVMETQYYLATNAATLNTSDADDGIFWFGGQYHVDALAP